MPSVSNIAVGALVAGAAASKARHGMNESIARLSTGLRSIYGGDAAGQSVANTLQARSKVGRWQQEMLKMVYLQHKQLSHLY